MPIFRNFEEDPVVPLLQEIRNGINNLGASFASSLGGLGNLNFDFPVFTHTELVSIDLLPDIPTLILPGESVARRNTLKNAQSSTGIIIFVQGIENPGIEDFLKSPWRLSPGSFREDDRDGGYPVWALAVGGAATVEVAIEYAENITEEEEPMIIRPTMGTGANWDYTQEWYKSRWNGLLYDNDYKASLDSVTTGFKLFTLESFTANKEYSLSVNIDAGFPGFSIADTYPINIYLIEYSSLVRAALWTALNIDPAFGLEDAKRAIPIIKEKSWIARLPAGGGIFKMRPNRGSVIGLIDGKVDDPAAPHAETLVWDYTQGTDTGTFLLKGY